jgi:hypothetical protein
MQRAHGAIEMLEQAVGLLRSAPAATVLTYLTGAIPFTVGLLFFLVDMTRSPFAFEHLGQASLGMALLYVWKCAWKGIFCARLYRELSPLAERRGGVWRTVSIQIALQPLKVPFFPLPWLIAFFRNLALFAGLGALHPVRTAGRQAGLWPRQNAVILLVISLASLLLFVNVLVMLIILPQLARSFLGIEGDLARLGAGLLNWTTTSIAAALTWLAIDPVLDAVYILRCFYGEAVTSGDDLRAALRKATVAAGLVLGLVLACLMLQPAVQAQDAPVAEQRTTAVDPARLDASIQEVIHRREFTWRVPLAQPDKDEGRIVSWLRSAWETIENLWDWIVKQLFGNREGSEPTGNGAAVTRRQLEILIAIVVALVAAAAIFFFRGKRRPVVAAQAVQGAAPAVDLTDETLTADQLPEDSWWKLADELRAKGELRLAMRALYLAGINHLAGRGLVSVRRWKTGLEYRRELDRRARATPGLPPEFARGVGLFELAWYGHSPVDQTLVEALSASIKDLRRQGETTAHGQSK